MKDTAAAEPEPTQESTAEHLQVEPEPAAPQE